MDENTPIYNSGNFKQFFEYIDKFYPYVDKDDVLNYAEMTMPEINDPGHWFSQKHADLFYERLAAKTKNHSLARDAGRYAVSSDAQGSIKQGVLGLMSPSIIYGMMKKLYAKVSRGATIETRKLSGNSIEIISRPAPGIIEKPYQCENRTGTFEAIAKLFTGRFADIDQPECLHRGDNCCRYIITWGNTFALLWKRIRNVYLGLDIIASLVSAFILPFQFWLTLSVSGAFIGLAVALIAEYYQKKDLADTLRQQGHMADELTEEINIRHANAMLVQEVGQATSMIQDTAQIIDIVIQLIAKYLDFDRGIILLANPKKTKLIYATGFGHTEKELEVLKGIEFNLDNPDSQGPFVRAYMQSKSFLINDIEKEKKKYSERSIALIRQMDVKSMICAPIFYEKQSIGILAVDNRKTKRLLTQSDMSILSGVAAQAAVGIINARSVIKIKNNEKKYRDLVENANSIILRRDIEGKITFFNEFAQKFFGYTYKEIIGKNICNIIHSDSRASRDYIAGLTDFLRHNPEHLRTDERENILRNGQSVWIAWTYKPIFDSKGNFCEILCIGNDLTKVKKAEKETRELEEQLQRSQKMEALGTLAGGVAHDLNNILSGIVSYPELLLMDMPKDSPMRKPMLTIQKSGEKAAAIVQDLLTLARRGVVVTQVVNLNQILSEYLDSPEYAKMIEFHPHVHLETEFEPDLLNISGSSVHLSKTIMNLISNAAEAISGNGTISITTQNRYIDKPSNGFDHIDMGDYCTLVIRDNGLGIEKKDLHKIFEPFYTKKKMGRSGTGLGMAVVWGTIKDHHGHIDVQSEPGKGTAFTLYFPTVRKKLPSNDHTTSIADLKGARESIIVVDDVEEQREIASHMLQKLDYSVMTFASGEAAVEHMQTHRADLLILDMIMDPGMDGLETYKKILEFHPTQKAIIASGFSKTEKVGEAQRLGAGVYIKKPYLIEKIGMAVKKELSNKNNPS